MTEALQTRGALGSGSPRHAEFAFPHHDHPPPCRAQVADVAPVARPITPQLGHPPRTIHGRQRALRAADVPVPEAAMHQDDGAIPQEDDVRPAGEPADVEAEAQAVAMERGADEALARGVMAADGGHDAGAGGGRGLLLHHIASGDAASRRQSLSRIRRSRLRQLA